MGERRSVEAMKARAEKFDVVVREREVAAAEQRLIYANIMRIETVRRPGSAGLFFLARSRRPAA